MERGHSKTPIIKSTKDSGEKIKDMAMVNYLCQTGQSWKGNGKKMNLKKGRSLIRMVLLMKEQCKTIKDWDMEYTYMDDTPINLKDIF